MLSKDALQALSKVAAEAFIDHKTPLNETIEKLAARERLSPDHIRRVSEGANHYVNARRMEKEAYTDFELADADRVISQLQKQASSGIHDFFAPPDHGPASEFDKEAFAVDLSDEEIDDQLTRSGPYLRSALNGLMSMPVAGPLGASWGVFYRSGKNKELALALEEARQEENPEAILKAKSNAAIDAAKSIRNTRTLVGFNLGLGTGGAAGGPAGAAAGGVVGGILGGAAGQYHLKKVRGALQQEQQMFSASPAKEASVEEAIIGREEPPTFSDFYEGFLEMATYYGVTMNPVGDQAEDGRRFVKAASQIARRSLEHFEGQKIALDEAAERFYGEVKEALLSGVHPEQLARDVQEAGQGALLEQIWPRLEAEFLVPASAYDDAGPYSMQRAYKMASLEARLSRSTEMELSPEAPLLKAANAWDEAAAALAVDARAFDLSMAGLFGFSQLVDEGLFLASEEEKTAALQAAKKEAAALGAMASSLGQMAVGAGSGISKGISRLAGVASGYIKGAPTVKQKFNRTLHITGGAYAGGEMASGIERGLSQPRIKPV